MQVFNANDGSNDTVKHSLVGIVRARFFRFQPAEFSTEKALRVEVYGILTTTGKLCKDSCLMSVLVLYSHSLISILIAELLARAKGAQSGAPWVRKFGKLSI